MTPDILSLLQNINILLFFNGVRGRGRLRGSEDHLLSEGIVQTLAVQCQIWYGRLIQTKCLHNHLSINDLALMGYSLGAANLAGDRAPAVFP